MNVIEAWRPLAAIAIVFLGIVVLERNSRRIQEPWGKPLEPQGVFLGLTCIGGGLALLVILLLLITIAQLEAV